MILEPSLDTTGEELLEYSKAELDKEGEKFKEPSPGKTSPKKENIAAAQKIQVFFASDSIKNHEQFFAEIGAILKSYNIEQIVANPIRDSLPLQKSSVLAICVGPNGSPISMVKRFVDIEKRFIVQIILPEGRLADVPLPNIEVFNFKYSNISEEAKRLVNFIQSKR